MKRFTLTCFSLFAALTLAGCSQQQSGQAGYIGSDAAQTVALEAAGVNKSTASITSTELGQENGLDYYTVLFTADGQQYEYAIDAITGVIIDKKVAGQAAMGVDSSPNAQAPADTGNVAPAVQKGSSNTASGGSANGLIGEAAAKDAALKHAGLPDDQVTFIQCKLDWDDGRQTYDVEFYTADYKEYDYEIDAQSGAVLSYDFDAEYYAPPTSSGKGISAEEAKKLALAQVPGATASDIREFSTDYDDGRLEYEGKIFYNGMEYEFEIDGYSGSMRNWEAEPWYS